MGSKNLNAASVWDPHTQADIKTLEKVQRRAARWVTSRYRQTSCVDSILTDLDWPTLQNRRKKHDWNYSTNSIKALLPSTPVTYQLHPTTDVVRGKTTPPATTFLAAELNIGKCHSSLGPSLSGMLYHRRSRRPSRWTVSSPGSPLSSNSTNPFPPPPLPPPSQIALVQPHNPHLIILYFEQKWKVRFWGLTHATHYCINTTEPSK